MDLQLPPEMWTKIFSQLDDRDRCNVVLVSKKFRDYGSDTRLWKESRINKQYLVALGFPALRTVPRFRQIASLDYTNINITQQACVDLCVDLANCSPPMDEVNLTRVTHLRLIDPETCVEGLSRVKKLNISYIDFPAKTLTSLLSEMMRKGVTRELDISHSTLLDVPTHTFTQMLESFSFLDLRGTILTQQQLSLLVDPPNTTTAKLAISIEAERLNDPGPNNPEMMVRDLIPGIFKRTSKLDLKMVNFSEFSTQRWMSSLSTLSGIQEFSIDGMGIDWTSLPCQLVADTLGNTTKLHLAGVEMSVSQWSQLFQKVSANNCLHSLSLKMVNLTDVPRHLTKSCFRTVRNLSLNFVCFSDSQWIRLFRKCFPKCQFKSLTVTNINLAAVPPEIVALTPKFARNLNLSSCYLAPSQSLALLKAAGQPGSRLDSLSLNSINLAKIPVDVLANVAGGVKVVGFAGTKLTPGHVVAILSRNLGSSRLRELDLHGVLMSGVPSKLFALSITRLRKVNLWNTFITREQVAALNAQMKTFTNLECIKMTHVSMLTHEIDSLSSRVLLETM